MTPTLPMVAILGPYLGDGSPEAIEANIAEAESYAIALANMGVGFFCPHTHTRNFEVKASAPESFYHRLDLTILSRAADAALFTPRWRSSPGACREHAYVTGVEMPCFYPTSPDDLGEVSEWAATGV